MPTIANSRGQPIGRFQMIQSDIAEMAVAIEASRAIVYKAAMMMDNSPPSNRIAATAKYHASQTASSAWRSPPVT